MAGPQPQPSRDTLPNLVLFFSFYAMLVLMLGLWSRALARRVAADNFHRSVRRFNKVMFIARVLVPIWFSFGVWVLGWGGVVAWFGTGMYKSVFGLMLGTMPAFCAWMGLWWSQYPAERALREQNLLDELDSGRPLYRPPAFRAYFLTNLRQQVLMSIAPVLLIWLVRDVFMWIAFTFVSLPTHPDQLEDRLAMIEGVSSILATGIVFLFVPAVLVRVLNTSPMPASPLRNRLESMCRRSGVRCREILIWHTANNVGNAAVMGLIPQVRFVLLTDMLLEQLTDDEIEAVFAHELGHVVHKHMAWYAIFMVVIALAGASLTAWGRHFEILSTNNAVAFESAMGMATLLTLFGLLSRRCERQADVYAARTMQDLQHQRSAFPLPLLVPPKGVAPGGSYVAEAGAAAFNAALCRVATINNIPITPRVRPLPGFFNRLAYWADCTIEFANDWLHGSIAGRMQFLQHLGADPSRTRRFDLLMTIVYFTLLIGLVGSMIASVISGAW